VSAGGPFAKFAALVAGAAAAGLWLAWVVGRSAEQRSAAMVAVAAAASSSGLGLVLKRKAMERGLNWALGVVGILFMVRLGMVGAGIWWAASAGLSAMAFAIGFLGEYVVLQWIEISYVLAEQKRRGRGGV